MGQMKAGTVAMVRHGRVRGKLVYTKNKGSETFLFCSDCYYSRAVIATNGFLDTLETIRPIETEA